MPGSFSRGNPVDQPQSRSLCVGRFVCRGLSDRAGCHLNDRELRDLLRRIAPLRGDGDLVAGVCLAPRLWAFIFSAIRTAVRHLGECDCAGGGNATGDSSTNTDLIRC